MLRIVLVDLADTLVIDGAPAALAALAELDTADGEPLRVETVSATAFGPALAGFGAAPADGLAITADADRAAESRAAGLPVVQVGVDVPDWSGVPAVVARLVDPDGVEEAAFVRSLREHGQLAEPGADAPTHRIDEDGRVRRERFRSI